VRQWAWWSRDSGQNSKYPQSEYQRCGVGKSDCFPLSTRKNPLRVTHAAVHQNFDLEKNLHQPKVDKIFHIPREKITLLAKILVFLLFLIVEELFFGRQNAK
jgi:hypothetical protein